MTDAELIHCFLDGEIQAFNRLVVKWQKPIYNFALKYLGQAEEAKDVTQKTFIKVYKNMETLKDQQKFASWIYQIALNLCRDEHKRRSRRDFFSVETLDESHKFDVDGYMKQAHNPERKLQRRELNEILQAALSKIPKEQKTVIIMKEFQGLKFIEIAHILGISVNTVKSRMYYGLHAIKKLLDQWQIDKEAIQYEL